MKINGQVVSLDLAKRMKELGFKQESLWWWIKYFPTDRPIIALISDKERRNSEKAFKCLEQYSAYTVAELGEMLPETIRHDGDNFYYRAYKDCIVYFHGKRIDFKAFAETEANVRAKMLIHLKEKGLL